MTSTDETSSSEKMYFRSFIGMLKIICNQYTSRVVETIMFSTTSTCPLKKSHTMCTASLMKALLGHTRVFLRSSAQ